MILIFSPAKADLDGTTFAYNCHMTFVAHCTACVTEKNCVQFLPFKIFLEDNFN